MYIFYRMNYVTYIHMQSAPRLIGQILLTGAQIFGKALAAAGKQAVQSTVHLLHHVQ